MPSELIGASPRFRAVLDQIGIISSVDSAVLLQGETGRQRIGRSAGIRRVEELDWWQSAKTTALPITSTQAQHFSARSPLDRNRALWGGFVLIADGARSTSPATPPRRASSRTSDGRLARLIWHS
jgi:L-ascorbate metabolism protein UlaG (beta-lactamase superfamily)